MLIPFVFVLYFVSVFDTTHEWDTRERVDYSPWGWPHRDDHSGGPMTAKP